MSACKFLSSPFPSPPQVLGLTATPASKASLHATLAGMRELARNLAAQYRVVAEDDQELLVSSSCWAGAGMPGHCCCACSACPASRARGVLCASLLPCAAPGHPSEPPPPSARCPAQSAVPDIEQEEVLVQLEPADDGLARRLGGFVVAAVERLREGLGLPGEAPRARTHACWAAD